MSSFRIAAASATLILGSSALVRGQEPATAPGPARPSAAVASAARTSRGVPAPLATEAPARASIRVDGVASPGLRIKLDGSGSTGGRIWFRWLQTEGVKVALEGRTAAEASFVVPADAAKLGFVLVVGDATGVDARSVIVDVDDPEREGNEAKLRADAGDDQSSKVGRKVILNGTRSEPRGKLQYRWIQAGGPKVGLKGAETVTASFVPSSPGSYSFALIAASPGGNLSEPSLVSVEVSGSARPTADPADASGLAIDELARVSLAGIDGGAKFADDLARAFDAVADRIAAYPSYSDAIAEVTRRIEPFIPKDKDRRSVWVERLFTPIVTKFAAGLRVEGLDLAQPAEQRRDMHGPERARLAEQLRYAASGFRAARIVR